MVSILWNQVNVTNIVNKLPVSFSCYYYYSHKEQFRGIVVQESFWWHVKTSTNHITWRNFTLP